MQALELVQTKTAWAHTQLDFPQEYWTWVVKYKANYFSWKNTKTSLILKQTGSWEKKIDDSDLKFQLIYEKSYKISIFIPSLLRS